MTQSQATELSMNAIESMYTIHIQEINTAIRLAANEGKFKTYVILPNEILAEIMSNYYSYQSFGTYFQSVPDNDTECDGFYLNLTWSKLA